MKKLNFDYLTAYSANQYAFMPMPYMLIENPVFSELGAGEKILYTLMLNRVSLSRNNLEQYTDKEGRLYIIYTVAQVEKSMCCSHPTAVKYLKNLTEIGLIERVRQGMGKPTITYVKDFASVAIEHGANNMRSVGCAEGKMPEANKKEQKLKNLTSGSKEFELQEVKKFNPSKIEYSHTDYSNPSLNEDNFMLGKRKNICLSEEELMGLREDYGNRLEGLLDECSDRIFARGSGPGLDPIKNYYRYIQTIAKTLGYVTDAQIAAEQAEKRAAAEAAEATEKAQAQAELDAWYAEKMQEYGVDTKEEIDRITEAYSKKLIEKWRKGDF
ncbi:replication initiator protein A [Ihubacter sp. mB4P-1]|uniref:replication initiator protein A n=1 Tax=Ihubacter sp. mB4P-1 TaxID=3242370 RepID=UPI00216BD298|nr:hypothetical protein [Emergencia sp.]